MYIERVCASYNSFFYFHLRHQHTRRASLYHARSPPRVVSATFSSWYVVRALLPLSSDTEEHGGGRLGSLSLASVGHATPAQWEHILLPRSNRGSTSNRTAHAQHFPRSPASCTRLSSRRSPLWSRRGRRAGAVYSDTPVLLSHSDNSMRLMRLFFKGRSALVRETSRERG